jgi:hypothetical protein
MVVIVGLVCILAFTWVSNLSTEYDNLQNIFPTAAPTPVILTGQFTGTLSMITYDQDGWYGSVSATHIMFSDGNSFTLEGNANYAIGLNYTVTYQYYKNADNGDTVITHTDSVQLAP